MLSLDLYQKVEWTVVLSQQKTLSGACYIASRSLSTKSGGGQGCWTNNTLICCKMSKFGCAEQPYKVYIKHIYTRHSLRTGGHGLQKLVQRRATVSVLNAHTGPSHCGQPVHAWPRIRCLARFKAERNGTSTSKSSMDLSLASLLR